MTAIQLQWVSPELSVELENSSAYILLGVELAAVVL